MGRRAFLTIVAFFAGVILADRLVGVWSIEEGRYGGRPLPPFGRLEDGRLRAWLAHQCSALAAGHHQPVFGDFHPGYGWGNRPGVSQGFSIDALGARGSRVRSREPMPGVTRILCLGDSYTYGAEVADGEDWPARLEELSTSTEVLNLGVDGWGTDQALLRFRREGRLLQGDVLVIGLHLQSIGRNVNRYRQMLVPSEPEVRVKPRFVLKDGGLELLPLPFRTREELLELLARDELAARLSEHEHFSADEPALPGSALARLWAGSRAHARRDHRRLWSDPDGEPFRVTLALLEAFEREARESGLQRVVVLISGSPDDLAQVLRDGVPYWRHLLDALDARGIAYIDAARALAPLAAEHDLFLRTHLSPEGNRCVARLVREWLDGAGDL